MQLLVTGGCGFIGSNFIRFMLRQHPGITILNIDKLTYAGNPENLRDIQRNPRYSFIQGDISDMATVRSALKQHDVDTVVHFAAESHVDRSIHDASAFIRTNVLGTGTLLEAAQETGIEKFVHISTDEVYGSTISGSFKETDNLNPSSPYAASKASSDLLALSYVITHDLPVLITRCTNNYGPYQYPEKLIPLFVTNLLEGKRVPIYGAGTNIRDWIYVIDHCRGIDFLLDHGKAGEIYNIGGGNEKTNIEITHRILELLEKDQSWINHVVDRPGHDYRYSLDCSKMRRLGWAPRYDFERGLVETVNWYQENKQWWHPLKTQNG